MCCTFPLCNKKPDRAPKIFGHTFILCWRCSGLIVGASLGYLILLLIQPIGIYSFALLIPIGVDGGMQYYLGVLSTNSRRFITGIIGGLSVIGYT